MPSTIKKEECVGCRCDSQSHHVCDFHNKKKFGTPFYTGTKRKGDWKNKIANVMICESIVKKK